METLRQEETPLMDGEAGIRTHPEDARAPRPAPLSNSCITGILHLLNKPRSGLPFGSLCFSDAEES